MPSSPGDCPYPGTFTEAAAWVGKPSDVPWPRRAQRAAHAGSWKTEQTVLRHSFRRSHGHDALSQHPQEGSRPPGARGVGKGTCHLAPLPLSLPSHTCPQHTRVRRHSFPTHGRPEHQRTHRKGRIREGGQRDRLKSPPTGTCHRAGGAVVFRRPHVCSVGISAARGGREWTPHDPLRTVPWEHRACCAPWLCEARLSPTCLGTAMSLGRNKRGADPTCAPELK